MDKLRDFSELQEAAETNLVDFLHTDLGVCSTFADLVRTEMQMGDGAAAQRVFAKAEQGYASIAHFLPRIRRMEQRLEMQCKLAGLRIALDSLQREFSLHSS